LRSNVHYPLSKIFSQVKVRAKRFLKMGSIMNPLGR
jgi:hypothetical protein